MSIDTCSKIKPKWNCNDLNVTVDLDDDREYEFAGRTWHPNPDVSHDGLYKFSPPGTSGGARGFWGGLSQEGAGYQPLEALRMMFEDDSIGACGWEYCQFSPPAVLEPVKGTLKGPTWDR